jgi:MULE transposase domain
MKIIPKLAYQLIIPYLEAFKKFNENSTIGYEKNLNGNMLRCFVCPGFMNTTLEYVVPVISLDACHLKGERKGTLYLATAQSGSHEIYTIAVGISADNECKEEWDYFLMNLKLALPILGTKDNFNENNRYNKFSFISDRERGIITGLNTNFPKSHHLFCAYHINRNVYAKHSRSGSKDIMNIAKTFSLYQENRYLQQLERNSEKAFTYVTNIDPKHWRSTAWLDDDHYLPPRYGIVTSNISESSNRLFESARAGTWLFTLDEIINKMGDRISEKRELYDGKDGIVKLIEILVKNNWDKAMGYKVSLFDAEKQKYKVSRLLNTVGEGDIRHNVDIINQTCTCGKFQDYGYPCICVCAYLRIYEKKDFDYVLVNYVSKYHTMKYQKLLYSKNINPIVVDNISEDGITKEPEMNNKRQPGRPQIARLRKRVNTGDDTTNKLCSRCKKPGHNKRTCETRQMMSTYDECQIIHDPT